jgi:hypothetical protein
MAFRTQMIGEIDLQIAPLASAKFEREMGTFSNIDVCFYFVLKKEPEHRNY